MKPQRTLRIKSLDAAKIKEVAGAAKTTLLGNYQCNYCGRAYSTQATAEACATNDIRNGYVNMA